MPAAVEVSVVVDVREVVDVIVVVVMMARRGQAASPIDARALGHCPSPRRAPLPVAASTVEDWYRLARLKTGALLVY